ncbi:hypothetical protein BH18ACT2_BH18ACT2_07110 [soil metagenome]
MPPLPVGSRSPPAGLAPVSVATGMRPFGPVACRGPTAPIAIRSGATGVVRTVTSSGPVVSATTRSIGTVASIATVPASVATRRLAMLDDRLEGRIARQELEYSGAPGPVLALNDRHDTDPVEVLLGLHPQLVADG